MCQHGQNFPSHVHALPPTFPSPSWSIDRERSGRDKYDCNRYSVPYQEIYHRLLPNHEAGTLLVRMGESCDWSHRNARDHAHAGAQFGYKANATGPVALERFANKTNKVGWNGLPFGVKLLIQNARGTAGTVLPLIPVRDGRDAQNFLYFPRWIGRRRRTLTGRLICSAMCSRSCAPLTWKNRKTASSSNRRSTACWPASIRIRA